MGDVGNDALDGGAQIAGRNGFGVEVDDSEDRLSNEGRRTRRSAEAEIAGRSDTDEESEAAAEAQFALDRNDAAH